MKRLLVVMCALVLMLHAQSQNMVMAAQDFIATLDAAQKQKAVYPFESAERYNFHFFPKDDRKGIPIAELNPKQQQAAFALMQTGLSANSVQKVQNIRQLEIVLKELEHRGANDHYRDPDNYYFILFGVPGAKTVWGWRFEGHHISFSFSADQAKIVSGTPAFMGANPAIVREGAKRSTQVLKEEADAGFALLHTLSKDQLQQALIDTTAPNEIITFVSRNAMIEHPVGIRYAQLNAAQQQQLLQLIGVYVHRYTKLFADALLKEIQEAGLDQLRFAWAGATEPQLGKPHYYRIQGPTLIIEYDNSQNGANHVHTVVRDLKNDFGGDLLLEHYKAAHG